MHASKFLNFIYAGHTGKERGCMTLRVMNHPGLPGTGPVSALKVLGNLEWLVTLTSLSLPLSLDV